MGGSHAGGTGQLRELMLGKVVVMEVIQLTQMRVLQLVVVITSSGGGNHAQVDGLVQLSLSRLLLLATNDQRQEAAVDCLHSAGSAGRHRAGVRQHHIGAGYRLPGGELDQHRGGAHLHLLLLTTVCGSGSRGDQSQWKRSGRTLTGTGQVQWNVLVLA